MAAITSNNVVVEVIISDQQQDGNPTYTPINATTINCLVRSYKRQSKLTSLDLASIADTDEKAYFTRASGTVELELYVDHTTGLAFQIWLYYYIKVSATFKVNGLDVTWIDEGVISDVSLSQDLDGIFTESITVTLGTYGVNGYGGYAP